MAIFENRIFRVTLLIVTLIVVYLWLQDFGDDKSTNAESRDDAAEEEILASSPLTESVTPPPVVRSAPDRTGALVAESETPETGNGVLEVQVQANDTLEKMAVTYQTTVSAIMAANPGKTNANLKAGETLRIVGASTDVSTVENPSTEREAGETVLYRVEANDFLSTIAQRYGVSDQALIDANPSVDPNALQVAQELTIPPIGTGLESTSNTVERPPGESTPYVIEAGDSLGYLAEEYGVTMTDILAANPEIGSDPSNIREGQQIVIPPSS